MKKILFNSENRFRLIVLIILLIITVFCVTPFILMISASLTDEQTLMVEGYKFLPSRIGLRAYEYLWAKRATIGKSYWLSIIVTIAGTIINVIITSLLAYPISRKDFKYRNIIAFYIFFTMLFSGGMTASYIIWSNLFRIKNTIWALMIPSYLMSGMNVLLVRNYYITSIPDSLIEAARIDGAAEMIIYRKIILPLSKPVMITITLFAGMAYWNDWVNGMYYISEARLYTINVYLNKLMTNISFLKSANSLTEGANLVGLDLPSISIRMAIAVVAILPVFIIFPFVQRQLIKGVVIGGIKG